MKWFWISFFFFLAVLVGSAAFTRPDTVDSTLDFVGRFLTVTAWAVLALVVGGALAGGSWWIWASIRARQERELREVDGRFPLQRYKLRDGRVLIYDPSLAIGPATIIDKRTGIITEQEPAAGWQIQATIRALVERTSGIQAAFQGDASRSSKYGSMARPGSAAGAARLIDAPRKPLALPEPPPVAAPIPAQVREWTPVEAMNQNTRTKLVLGQAGGNLVKWDMTERPHLRFHGMSQNGKTTAIQTVAAAAIRTQAHVIVLDRRKFKDWSAFRDCAELVDTRDPAAFAETVTKLRDIYQARDVTLGQAGAANISELERPPQRIVVVVAEFGALCVAAQDEGVLKDVIGPLQLIMREAGATGVHMLIEDQAVKDWPRGIVANAEPVSGYLPMNYGSTGGYHNAHQLQPYQFHYAGTVFKTFDMRAALPVVLAGMPRATRLVSGEKAVHSQFTEPVHSQFTDQFTGDSLSITDTPPPPAQVVNCTPGAPTTVDGWYEWTLDTYLPTHPQLLQVDAQGRGVGVKALGEAMAEHNGKGYEAMKGAASEVAKRIRGDVIEGGFGRDISVSA